MIVDLARAQQQGIAPWQELRLDLDQVKVYADAFPVTPGHRLFVPRTDSDQDIARCLQQAYRLGRIMIDQGMCDGFNVGMNWGASAGQTVMYPHVHLIPRRHGDTQDPTGGVRRVIPGRGNYRSPEYGISTD